MSKLVIISGNPTKKSRLNSMTEYAAEILQQHGVSVAWVHVADLPTDDLLYARFDSPSIQQANELVAAADAVIIASPVYKAAYTGVLKTYLDLLPQKALREKIILPLFIGGTIAHLLSLDYALKPVLAALGGRFILAGVYAVDSWIVRSGDGFELTEELEQRLKHAVLELVDELAGNEDRGTRPNQGTGDTLVR